MATPTEEALFRYSVVSQVLTREHAGQERSDAVNAVAALAHPFADSTRAAKARSIYRWLSLYQEGGVAGLEPKVRQPRGSQLDKRVLDFLREEKSVDRDASVPELIRRARELGIVPPEAALDRSSVYRACRSLGLPLARRKRTRDRDVRRFAYPHRLDMVLCDGKHFRAGAARAKRVALSFLDDATRLVLHTVVGTAESTALFLRGLYECIRKVGFPTALYLDRGPGFIATDTAAVVGKLGCLLIHGAAAYPEGHGKIERFHRTFGSDLLRGLDGRPDVDPGCGALELRLQHYAERVYAHRPHESLGQQTPYARFCADTKPLRFPLDDHELRSRFELHVRRRVTVDHVVSAEGVHYEVPRGYGGQWVMLRKRVLDRTIALLHEGRLIELRAVDLLANARDRRGLAQDDTDDVGSQKQRSAADLAFERDFGPIVDKDFGLDEPPPPAEGTKGEEELPW